MGKLQECLGQKDNNNALDILNRPFHHLTKRILLPAVQDNLNSLFKNMYLFCILKLKQYQRLRSSTRQDIPYSFVGRSEANKILIGNNLFLFTLFLCWQILLDMVSLWCYENQDNNDHWHSYSIRCRQCEEPCLIRISFGVELEPRKTLLKGSQIKLKRSHAFILSLN